MTDEGEVGTEKIFGNCAHPQDSVIFYRDVDDTGCHLEGLKCVLCSRHIAQRVVLIEQRLSKHHAIQQNAYVKKIAHMLLLKKIPY